MGVPVCVTEMVVDIREAIRANKEITDLATMIGWARRVDHTGGGATQSPIPCPQRLRGRSGVSLARQAVLNQVRAGERRAIQVTQGKSAAGGASSSAKSGRRRRIPAAGVA